MLRNDASKFRARRSPSGAAQRTNAASRSRRLTKALAAATFAVAFVSASADVVDVYAQYDRAQANAQRGEAASKAPLFSGKFARNVSEKFSRDSEVQKQQKQTSARRYAQTPERSAGGRSNYPAASASSGARASSAQRSFAAPNRGYAAPRAAGSNAATSAEALAQPSTNRESAQEALAKIPWQALSPSAREKLAALAKNPTIYRRLPMAGGYCNPELFDFFLTHPHAVVGLWRQMGYDDVSMAPVGPNLYSVREKTGTVGRAQILYQDDELTLVYCHGQYQSPIVPRSLDGEMFLVLQTRYTEDPTGRPIVVCRLDAFVDLKNPGADLLARTFSGALGKLADSNFEQTLAFIDNVSQTAETNPGALSASIAGLSELSPEARRLFAAKTSEIARQAQLRARGTYVDYRLLPKLNSPETTVARVLSRERAGAADAAIAARTRAATPAPGATFPGSTANATSGRAGSTLARSPLSPTPSTLNSFDKPSLAQNSFALSDDSESDFDFESELDWNDEEPLKVGGARVAQKPISAPTLVPETSVAKATARPSTRFSDALDLVEAPDSVAETDDYATSLSAAPATLATDDEFFADSEPTASNAVPLLLDFENELLEESDANAGSVANSAASPVAKPVPLQDFPTTNAADAIALPKFAPVAVNPNAKSNDESNDVATPLPVLVFDDAAQQTPENASSLGAADETAPVDDIPLLVLPDFEAADAVPTLESPTQPAKKPSPKVALKNDLTSPKARGRVVAPVLPNAKKTSSAKSSAKPSAKPTPTSQAPRTRQKSTSTANDAPAPLPQTPAPVWRAVEQRPASQAQVAPPIAETARVATEKGATFRKPEIH